MSKFFLVAAGGTGMRCLQSFVQMCALGMYPNRNISILLLETDEQNKDKKNTENLLKWYKDIQSSGVDRKKAVVDKMTTDGAASIPSDNSSLVGGFFSANIDLYTFVPDYSKDDTRNFVVLSQVERGNSEVNHKLANIFYEEPVQEFPLAHGYRAQTHLGSYLMYHAMIEDIRKAMSDDKYIGKSQLLKFIQQVQKASASGGARVFALGSTFGGTGASSIPVITRAITDSCKILTGDMIQMENIYYGGVVLSAYFKFSPPSDAHKKKDKIIAQSEFFKHNSASALMYYVNDPTILQTYKKLYLLGWGGDGFDWCDTDIYKKKYLSNDEDTITATGGKNQENPCHLIELFGAFAAKHFFEEQSTSQKSLDNILSTEFKYKSLEVSGKSDSKNPIVHWEDLFSLSSPNTDKNVKSVSEEIQENFAGLICLSAIINSYYDKSLNKFLDVLKRYNMFFEIDDIQEEAVSDYLSTIYSKENPNGVKEIPGWIKQLYLTFHGEMNTPREMFFGLNGDVLEADNDGISWWQLFNLGKDEKSSANRFIETMRKQYKPSGKNAQGLGDFLDLLRATVKNTTIINTLRN